jgi:hypothetical protein
VRKNSQQNKTQDLGFSELLRYSHRLVRKTQETQSSLQECLINCVSQTAKKQSNPPSAPFPTVAQSDYFQNGLVLPREPKNLELLLRDVDTKGFLDIELVYRLRQKESLGSVKQKIVRKIQQNESVFCFEESVLSVLAEAP